MPPAAGTFLRSCDRRDIRPGDLRQGAGPTAGPILGSAPGPGARSRLWRRDLAGQPGRDRHPVRVARHPGRRDLPAHLVEPAAGRHSGVDRQGPPAAKRSPRTGLRRPVGPLAAGLRVGPRPAIGPGDPIVCRMVTANQYVVGRSPAWSIPILPDAFRRLLLHRSAIACLGHVAPHDLRRTTAKLLRARLGGGRAEGITRPVETSRAGWSSHRARPRRRDDRTRATRVDPWPSAAQRRRFPGCPVRG